LKTCFIENEGGLAIEDQTLSRPPITFDAGL
jgi:hypothetical protein